MFRILSLFMILCFPAFANVMEWQRQFPLGDFTKFSVDFDEFQSGGPPRDGIPSLNNPKMILAASEAAIPPTEPVLVLKIGSDVRGYPLRYMIWHEIANDVVGGIPVVVTFCPLCNSALVFDRRQSGEVLSFGVTGLLRHSDMVMYDHQTESFWQQAVGEALTGHYTGTQLRGVPSQLLSWSDFHKDYPNAKVMAQPAFQRDYGRNPYSGYDGSKKPFLYTGDPPPHNIPALARVIRVGNRAWLLSDLIARDEIRDGDVVLRWRKGMNSALDAGRIEKGRDIGMVEALDARGQALVHDVMFAFAFDALFPQGVWRLK